MNLRLDHRSGRIGRNEGGWTLCLLEFRRPPFPIASMSLACLACPSRALSSVSALGFTWAASCQTAGSAEYGVPMHTAVSTIPRPAPPRLRSRRRHWSTTRAPMPKPTSVTGRLPCRAASQKWCCFLFVFFWGGGRVAAMSRSCAREDAHGGFVGWHEKWEAATRHVSCISHTLCQEMRKMSRNTLQRNLNRENGCLCICLGEVPHRKRNYGLGASSASARRTPPVEEHGNAN
mmetsp:Transcript_29469/g.77506  ORF Transcript_29469/g.77506 Transcript_29469/m.77506 type:complete len:233 (+) Transcript_29469:357-1055(+)